MEQPEGLLYGADHRSTDRKEASKMPQYEVETVFKVVASDENDAVRRLRALLDRVTITLESGVRSYAILDGAATEVKP